MARTAAGVALLVVASAACGADVRAGDDVRVVRVAAASSLTEVFTDLAEQFEADHAPARVELSFAASSAIAHQVREGAPIDVVATADRVDMDRLIADGAARIPAAFARARMVIAVARGNPKQVRDVDDLARRDVVFVTCAPEVPCGRLAVSILRDAGVTRPPASFEENVKAVVAKVVLGEADVGLVYETDVRAATTRLELVPVVGATGRDGAASTHDAVYHAALTTTAASDSLAKAWLDFLGTPRAVAALTKHGFVAE